MSLKLLAHIKEKSRLNAPKLAKFCKNFCKLLHVFATFYFILHVRAALFEFWLCAQVALF